MGDQRAVQGYVTSNLAISGFNLRAVRYLVHALGADKFPGYLHPTTMVDAVNGAVNLGVRHWIRGQSE
jgi:hypothetical protein